MVKVAVVGAYGKLGSLVCKKLEAEFELEKIGRNQNLKMSKNLELVIDLASGSSSAKSAEFCRTNGVRLLVGSTGQSDAEMAKIIEASKCVPTLYAGNFSVGILLMKRLICEVLKQNVSEICIFEKHHKNKADIPSGTAIELAGLIKKLTNVPPQILSERGGEEVGTHAVDFYFGSEVISIKHKAFSREVFANGAAMSAKFLLGQKEKKLYHFEDVLN